MNSSVVDRHDELLQHAVDINARIAGGKLGSDTVVVTEAEGSNELISTHQYINLNRLPENLQKVQLVGDPLSGDLLSQQVVELTTGSDFVTNQVGTQYYDEELLPQDLTEEDKRLAAALVAVQFVQQQKQQHSILTSELLKGSAIPQLSPLQSVSLEKPVTAMVTSYFQPFEDESGQHQLLDAHNQERMLKIYQAQPAAAPINSCNDLRLPPLPPLKKVLSSQSLMRNRYDRTNLMDHVPTQDEDNDEDDDDKESRLKEQTNTLGKGEESGDIDPLDCDEGDSDYEGEENLKSSKRSLPHKKRIPRKLKAQPSRNLLSKYKCQKCGDSFGSQSALASHRLTHQSPPKKGVNNFSCEICGFQSCNQVRFFEHLKEHYEPNLLQIANEVIDQPNINIEYTPASDSQVIEDSFILKQVLTEQPTSTNIKCNQCGRVFRRQKAYDSHVALAHPPKDEFSEPEDMMEGIRHVVDIQTGTADDDGEVKIKDWKFSDELDIPADICMDSKIDDKLDSKSETKVDNKPDMPENSGEESETEKGKKRKKAVQCPQCTRTFTHRNSLLYHVRSHSGRRPHQCDVCGKGFFAANALRVHMRLHSGDKPYRCEVCSRNFRQWGDLKYHMTSLHSDTKQYQCEFCGKDFARKYSLIVHRRIHTGEKNYICEFCRKPFRASSYLVNHRRIHTGEKPYTCDVCCKPFRVKSDMKRHRNTHNKDKGVVTPVPELPVAEPSEPETILPETQLPLDLNMRQDSTDSLSYTRDPLDRDSNTLFVWIPTPGESILPD